MVLKKCTSSNSSLQFLSPQPLALIPWLLQWRIYGVLIHTRDVMCHEVSPLVSRFWTVDLIHHRHSPKILTIQFLGFFDLFIVNHKLIGYQLKGLNFSKLRDARSTVNLILVNPIKGSDCKAWLYKYNIFILFCFIYFL